MKIGKMNSLGRGGLVQISIRRGKDIQEATQKVQDLKDRATSIDGGPGLLGGAVKGALVEAVGHVSTKAVLGEALMAGAKSLALVNAAFGTVLGGIAGALVTLSTGSLKAGAVAGAVVGLPSAIKMAVEGAVDGAAIGTIAYLFSSSAAVASLGLPGIAVAAGAGVIYNLGKYAVKKAIAKLKG